MLTYVDLPWEDDALSKTLLIEGDSVNLLWFVPITRAEWSLKKESGLDALLDVIETLQGAPRDQSSIVC